MFKKTFLVVYIKYSSLFLKKAGDNVDFLLQNTDALLWLVLMIIFLIAEAATSALFSIWFAAGALASMLIALLQLPGWMQILVFLAVSGIILLLAKPLTEKMVNQKAVKTNADRVLDAVGFVTEEINNLTSRGQVTVLGQGWSARSADNTVIAAGEKIRVKEIDGVKLIVEKTEREEL
ncbi:MAG: NfeD family protein [Ruminococcaceae bacterium]|nr:NfeD family protein [Oscillospiraceae bacterium]